MWKSHLMSVRARPYLRVNHNPIESKAGPLEGFWSLWSTRVRLFALSCSDFTSQRQAGFETPPESATADSESFEIEHQIQLRGIMRR